MKGLQALVILVLAFGSSRAQQAGYVYRQPVAAAAPVVAASPPAPASARSSYGGGGYSYPPASSSSYHGRPAAAPGSLKTEVFLFASPEDPNEEPQAEQQFAAAVQKRVRIVFIRAPENRALEKAAFGLAKQSGEDKTAIYVLNKQTDLGDLANRLNAVRDQHSQRPEVNFVKYRTPEEALLAQQQIQAQYDALQGSTLQNSNEGFAPVLNYGGQQQQLEQQQYQQPAAAPEYAHVGSSAGSYAAGQQQYGGAGVAPNYGPATFGAESGGPGPISGGSYYARPQASYTAEAGYAAPASAYVPPAPAAYAGETYAGAQEQQSAGAGYPGYYGGGASAGYADNYALSYARSAGSTYAAADSGAAVSKLNERVRDSRLVFPGSEGRSANAYLPPPAPAQAPPLRRPSTAYAAPASRRSHAYLPPTGGRPSNAYLPLEK